MRAHRELDPTRPKRSARSRRRVGGAVTAAVSITLVMAAGCSATSGDDVVSAGPAGTNPETPAIDNPTTSALSTTSSTGAGQATTTTDPDAAASTSTSVPTTATSVPPAVSVPTTAPGLASLSTQIFWVRAPGDDRVLDIPGYRDPETGPRPLVLYGAVTNDGSSPVPNPVVTATWLDASGAPAGSFAADVVEPGSTTAMTAIAPGQTGDVIVVVTDPAVAARLADLVPELTATGG